MSWWGLGVVLALGGCAFPLIAPQAVAPLFVPAGATYGSPIYVTLVHGRVLERRHALHARLLDGVVADGPCR